MEIDLTFWNLLIEKIKYMKKEIPITDKGGWNFSLSVSDSKAS